LRFGALRNTGRSHQCGGSKGEQSMDGFSKHVAPIQIKHFKTRTLPANQ